MESFYKTNMKRLLFIGIIQCFVLSIYTQKKVYFESEQEKNVSISPYKGIEMGLGSVMNESGLKGNFTIGYFTESLLSKSSSLIWGAKTINTIYKNYSLPNDFTNFQSKYGLQLAVFAEPRWYFNYKKRILTGKPTGINTAWFLSSPIELSTSYIKPNNPLSLALSVPLTIGFRSDLSKQFFIECSGGVGIFYEFSSVIPLPVLRLKGGYIF